MSLRIFGEDITSAGREAAAKKKQSSEATPDIQAEPESACLEVENAGATGKDGVTGMPDEA